MLDELQWTAESEFTLRGTEFRATSFNGFESTPDRFFLMKPRVLVEKYVALLRDLSPRTIFELGIFRGGSTAFLSHLAEPERMVAVELNPKPVDALTEFIDRFGYGDAVKTCYGVDQVDAATLNEIADREFRDAPLDLVLDDASHQLDATRASFNALFPRLRPGGLYVIEDWSWGLFAFARPSDDPLLAPLVFELLCAVPYHEGLIENVVVDKYWAVVERGSGPLPPGPFDLRTCYSDRARPLLAR